MDLPVFIICRDRLSCLQQLTAWFTRAGLHDLILVDNASSYPPLLAWYEQCPWQVLRLPVNIGPRGLWSTPIIEQLTAGRKYLVSDCDILPDSSCPLDAVQRLEELLERYPEADRVGLGLRIDDIPHHYPHRDLVIRWESQFWETEVEPGVFLASVDTTFALHRPWLKDRLTVGLRTGTPFIARHLPWYMDRGAMSEEDIYYEAHASRSFANWNFAEAPLWKEEWLKKHGGEKHRHMISEPAGRD